MRRLLLVCFGVSLLVLVAAFGLSWLVQRGKYAPLSAAEVRAFELQVAGHYRNERDPNLTPLPAVPEVVLEPDLAFTMASIPTAWLGRSWVGRSDGSIARSVRGTWRAAGDGDGSWILDLTITELDDAPATGVVRVHPTATGFYFNAPGSSPMARTPSVIPSSQPAH